MDLSPVTRRPQDAQTVRRLRLGIGAVGVALPVMLVAGHSLVTGRPAMLSSLSAYYYTELRDVFVGSLCATGVFLISYRHRKIDDLLSTIAGALAIIVALFPAATQQTGSAITTSDVVVGRVHLIAAAALFVILALFCLVLFPRRDPREVPTRVRRGLYYACGGLILAAIAVALASNALPEATRDMLRPLFWCETVAVLAFGAAWFAKGEAMFGSAPATEGPTPEPDPSVPAAVTEP